MFPLRRSTIVILFLAMGAVFSWMWFFRDYRGNPSPWVFPPPALLLGAAVYQEQPSAAKDWRLAVLLRDPANAGGASDVPWIQLLPVGEDGALDAVQSLRMIRWMPLWFTAVRDFADGNWPVVGRVMAGNREHPVSMDLLYIKGAALEPGQIGFRWQGKTFRVQRSPDAEACAVEIAAALETVKGETNGK